MYRWLLIIWLIICNTTAFADILALSGYEGQQNIDKIRRLIAPLELIETGRPGWDPVAIGVIERFSSRPGRGPMTLQVRFHNLAKNQQTESITVDTTWFVVRNEPDTLRDLSILFGMPQEGVRIGSRRHVGGMVSMLKGTDRETAGLRFEGAGIRWLNGKTHSEEDLLEFERLGGTWLEFPSSQAFELPLRELVAIVAADRRYHHLETGFERAAISLMRGWVQGVSESITGDVTGSQEGERHLSILMGLAFQRIGLMAPGSIFEYDPKEVRNAFESMRSANKKKERDMAKNALRVAIANSSSSEKLGRQRWTDPVSAVDPSELAMVWIDTMRAANAFRTDLPLLQNEMKSIPFALAAFCYKPDYPDPRQNDRHDLWPHMLQFADELFAPESGEDTEFRRLLYDNLWAQLLKNNPAEKEEYEREVNLLFAAGWGTPSTIDTHAEKLLYDLKQEALYLKREHDPDELVLREKRLDARLYTARAMYRASEFGGVDPSRAIGRQFQILKKEVEAVQERIKADRAKGLDPKVSDDFKSREYLITKWETMIDA